MITVLPYTKETKIRRCHCCISGFLVSIALAVHDLLMLCENPFLILFGYLHFFVKDITHWAASFLSVQDFFSTLR